MSVAKHVVNNPAKPKTLYYGKKREEAEKIDHENLKILHQIT